MKEIKFRGKSIATGEWKYGYYVHFRDSFRKREAHCISTGFGDSMPEGDRYDYCCAFEDVDPKTIGQYTGLHDVEGNDIYEGDVLSTPSGVRHIVIFNEEESQFAGLIPGLKEKDGKPFVTSFVQAILLKKERRIIGNIHDCPELLIPEKK